MTETNSDPLKILYLGDTGSGKTGSIAALIASGYHIRHLDLESGAEILQDYLKNPASPYLKPQSDGLWDGKASLAENYNRVPMTEAMLIQAKNFTPKGDLWNRIVDQLGDWKTQDGKSLGHIQTWGPQDVLVIDGLSRLAKSAFNFELKMNGRLMTKPQQADYHNAQQLVIRALELLYSPEIKCNIILICHIRYQETEEKVRIGYPQTVGSAISEQIGQYFNHALLAKENLRTGKRAIFTSARGIALKSAAPMRVKPEYDLSTGLAEYFRDVRKEG